MTLSAAAAQTVTTVPVATRAAPLMFGEYWRGPILPSWGSQDRERVLRRYDRYEYNSLWQGAVTGLARRVAVTPWEIRAPAGKDARYWQDLFRGAWFGRGWDQLVKATVRDYCRHDRGAFWEIVGPGDPMGPILGRVTGINLLDPLRCTPTGDPFFPVLYYNTAGELHLLHRDRVKRFLDAPDSDEDRPGLGLCALSRAIAVCTRELRMGRYVDTALDDEPPPGIGVLKNILEQDVYAEARKMRERLRMDTPDLYGRTVFLHAAEGTLDADLKMIPYTAPPAKFDFREYTELDARIIALETGVDPQDVFPLSGGQMGTGTQSEVMAAKGKGNGLADHRTMITRTINDLLPEEFEFAFQFRDDEQDSQQAATRLANVQAIQTAAGNLSAQEVRRFLAAVDDVFSDILTDDAGRVTTLDDADPQSAEQVAGDESPVEDDPDAVAPVDDTPAESAPTAPTLAERFASLRAKRYHAKAWARTRADFVARVSDLVRGGLDSEIKRRRFTTVMRAHLQRLGLEAFRDGLEDGGVDREDMDDRDLKAVETYLAEQTDYIPAFADAVYQGKLSPDGVTARANLWANKSLRGFYQLGQASAAWNANFLWEIGPTEEHCADCVRLNGQIHRMRAWREKGWLPGAERLSCKGFECKCTLSRTDKKASGRF